VRIGRHTTQRRLEPLKAVLNFHIAAVFISVLTEKTVWCSFKKDGAAGVTLFEALKAHDELAKQGIAIRVVDLYSIVPIDRATLLASARATNNLMLTVEDHYAHGGLGDAVLAAVNADGVKVHKIAVTEIPHSGKPDQLLDRYGIIAKHIVEKVKKLVS